MAPEDFGGLGLWVRARVLTLREVDAPALLADLSRWFRLALAATTLDDVRAAIVKP
jgi:hypothetical protein